MLDHMDVPSQIQYICISDILFPPGSVRPREDGKKNCWNTTVAAYDFSPLGVSSGPFSEKKTSRA